MTRYWRRSRAQSARCSTSCSPRRLCRWAPNARAHHTEDARSRIMVTLRGSTSLPGGGPSEQTGDGGGEPHPGGPAYRHSSPGRRGWRPRDHVLPPGVRSRGTARSPEHLGYQVSCIIALYWENVDAAWERAVAAGAEVIYALEDQFYGERGGRLRDPFGQQWMMSQHIEDVSAEETARRAAALFGR